MKKEQKIARDLDSYSPNEAHNCRSKHGCQESHACCTSREERDDVVEECQDLGEAINSHKRTKEVRVGRSWSKWIQKPMTSRERGLKTKLFQLRTTTAHVDQLQHIYTSSHADHRGCTVLHSSSRRTWTPEEMTESG